MKPNSQKPASSRFDLVAHPHRAKVDHILAIPTVVRVMPTPIRTLIGDLSETENMLAGLEMPSAG